MTRLDLLDLLGRQDRAQRPALRAGTQVWTYAELDARVGSCAAALAAHRPRVIATLMDNGPQWIALDLACLRLGAVHLPLPLFFTPAQRLAALAAAGADLLVCHAGMLDALQPLPVASTARSLHEGMALQPLSVPPADIPAGTAKITFTSGSTGQPKGVCLGASQMLDVAQGVAQATRALEIGVHLSALPLPVLLENVAGVYTPLLEGAMIDVPGLAEVGLQGSSRFDPARFHAALTAAQANSVILLPQMLRAYAGWLHATGTRAPSSLTLAAVGGASVGAPLLDAARRAGVPAYEGYGLSEGASVQCLNLPGADLPGSAGRPLPHARVRVAEDGEIEISGPGFLGYLGAAPQAGAGAWWPTGDLGRIDASGFVHVDGRKKNVLITGFGRNVSPEWVETELAGQAPILHAVVLGDGEPALGAVIWPLADATDAALDAAVARANARLPDYARIARWTRGRAVFSAASGLATSNGRPLRAAILQQHADLFQESALVFKA